MITKYNNSKKITTQDPNPTSNNKDSDKNHHIKAMTLHNIQNRRIYFSFKYTFKYHVQDLRTNNIICVYGITML